MAATLGVWRACAGPVGASIGFDVADGERTMTTGAQAVVSDRVFTLPNVLSVAAAGRRAGLPVGDPRRARRPGPGRAHAFSGVTDYLDGKIARQFGLVSRVGQLLDPLADRLYILDAGRPGLARHHPVVAGRSSWSPASCSCGVVVLSLLKRLRPDRACRCTSSARPRPSTCSTPSRCCCSATATARSPGGAPPVGWALRLVGDRALLAGRRPVCRPGCAVIVAGSRRPPRRRDGTATSTARPRRPHDRAARPDESMTLLTAMMERPLDPGLRRGRRSAATAAGLPRATVARAPVLLVVAAMRDRACSSPSRALACARPDTPRLATGRSSSSRSRPGAPTADAQGRAGQPLQASRSTDAQASRPVASQARPGRPPALARPWRAGAVAVTGPG